MVTKSLQLGHEVFKSGRYLINRKVAVAVTGTFCEKPLFYLSSFFQARNPRTVLVRGFFARTVSADNSSLAACGYPSYHDYARFGAWYALTMRTGLVLFVTSLTRPVSILRW